MKGGNGGHSLARELRLQIMASPQELKAVDTFRFERGSRSGAAAPGVLKAPKGVANNSRNP